MLFTGLVNSRATTLSQSQFVLLNKLNDSSGTVGWKARNRLVHGSLILHLMSMINVDGFFAAEMV